MTLKTYRIVSLLLTAAFLLAACSPAPAPTAPTVDLTDIANQVSTAVAGTIAAQQTGTAAAQPPTETPAPNIPPTITPVLPTATPFVVPTATSYSSSGGGSGSTTAKYACDIIRQRPLDNSEFKPGDDFDIKWTIVNTGTATWPAGTDFKYFSGPKMTSAGALELPQMKPGDQYSVAFDARAPSEKGFQVMTWSVQGGFCYPYVAIIVD